jgi:DNA-binding SARP family transcriptional activator
VPENHGGVFHDGDVEFRLLGPLEVRVRGQVVEIGSPKHRVLLAHLLLLADQTVSIEELAEAVWGSAQPANPRRTVQVHVTRLRKILAFHTTGEIIATQADGYQIDVRPEQIDLGRFHQCLERVEEAAGRGDLEGEAAALGEALSEWRGEPLAGIPSELLQREVAPKLREEWLQTVEQRLDVELRRGRHATMVGELLSLTTQHPLRERLWSLLMKALYGDGRRSEALDAYHTVRRHLADELGIEPGEELRSLHALVLDGRHQPAPGGSAVLPAVPRQLPLDVPAFTGRVKELAALDALLAGHPAGGRRAGRPPSTVVGVIIGTAGVGKTALAAYWARRVADSFPDGQLWMNLRGYDPGVAVQPEQALRRFLRALGVSDAEIPLDLEDLTSLYRSLMDGRRMLIVLDNAGAAGQIRPLLPGAPGSLVLITSRNRLSGLVAVEGARPLELDLLTRAEARQLLATRIGADRTAADQTARAAVEEIIRLCARLPLALTIVAARAATNPRFGLHTLATEIKAHPVSLDAFAGQDDATELRAVFSWSYHALGEEAARLFRLLGLHPGPDIAAAAAASLTGLAVARVRPLLLELCGAHLLTEHSPGRYTFHDLLRAYAAELAHAHDNASERRQAQHRMLDHYLHTAHNGAVFVSPWEPVNSIPPQPGVTTEEFAGHRQVLAWCSTEHHVLLAIIERAATMGFPAYTWELAWILAEYLYRGHWHDWARVMRVALDAATEHGALPERARAHRELSRVCTRLGQLDAAEIHCKLALELCTQLGRPALVAMAHRTYGMLMEALGRQDDALVHDLKALDLFQAIGHRSGQARALNSVGWTYAQIGDHQKALEYCEQALSLLIDLEDHQGAAATWDSLGYAHHHLGHHRRAISCYGRALVLFRDLGDRYKEAESLTHIGDLHHAAGDAAAAFAAWEQALGIRAELGHDLRPLHLRLRDLRLRQLTR